MREIKFRSWTNGAWRMERLATKISLDHITGEIIGNIYENHWEAE